MFTKREIKKNLKIGAAVGAATGIGYLVVKHKMNLVAGEEAKKIVTTLAEYSGQAFEAGYNKGVATGVDDWLESFWGQGMRVIALTQQDFNKVESVLGNLPVINIG